MFTFCTSKIKSFIFVSLILIQSGGSEQLILENFDKLKQPFYLLTYGNNNINVDLKDINIANLDVSRLTTGSSKVNVSGKTTINNLVNFDEISLQSEAFLYVKEKIRIWFAKVSMVLPMSPTAPMFDA